MTVVEDTHRVVLPRPRSRALDALRGLAILLMVADHLILVLGLEPAYRWGPTRAALPIFAVIAGHLVRRWGLRWQGIAALGLVLGVLVPWAGAADVLVGLSIGALVLAYLPVRFRWAALVLLLTLGVNGLWTGPGYPPAAITSLMIAGALMPRSVFAFAERLPRFLVPLGRHPLAIYVVHLLILQGALLAWGPE